MPLYLALHHCIIPTVDTLDLHSSARPSVHWAATDAVDSTYQSLRGLGLRVHILQFRIKDLGDVGRKKLE